MGYVEIVGLHKHFGDVRAVDGVDLSIDEGELLVLLGPSGCGKTTLMRMVAGLEVPTRGTISIAGERVDESVPPRARGIAMVFQSYALYPHKTAYDNIAFPLQAVRDAPSRVRDKVHAGATRFRIAHLLGRFPRQLSGGERQRVALARAVVRDPRIFLFDEPLSNLDAKLRATARFELKEFQRQIGRTTMYVTHDQVEAMGLGDRIAVMEKGRVRQIGTPQDVYDHPADTFVATFLGSPPMNLIDGPDAKLGFRPENFLPAEVFAADDPTVRYRFRVRQVEHLGADRLVYGSLEERGGDDEPVIADLPVTIRTPIEEGVVYDFAVARRALRRFHRATGVRIPDGA